MPLLLYPRTRIPTELSKFYVISSSKIPLFDSDIDSSHQKPSNEIPNSPKKWIPSGRIRLLMTISFAIYVLTKSLHLTNYRKFTLLEAPKPPCVIVISIPLIKSRRMRCLTSQKDEAHQARYGPLCLLASQSTCWRSPDTDRIIEILRHKQLRNPHMW
jgi:hypothetical protein